MTKGLDEVFRRRPEGSTQTEVSTKTFIAFFGQRSPWDRPSQTIPVSEYTEE
jgi:hypothetical protein